MPLKKLFLSVVAMIAPVLLVAFSPFNLTYADVIDLNVKPKWTNYAANWQFMTNRFDCTSGGWCWGADSYNQVDTRTDGLTVRKIRFNLPNGIILGSGDYITAQMYIRQTQANNSLDTVFGPMKSDTSHITLIDTNVAPASNTNYLVKFTFYVESTITVSNTTTYVTIGSSRAADYNILWAYEANGSVSGGVVNFYSTVANTDYTAKLNELSTGITNLNSKLNNTNNKLDTVNSNLTQLKNSQDQANQDAQDRYDQEKQEENDREQQGSADNSSVLGLFNFNVLNPFAPIFNMFSSSCSVSIPTLSSWINSPSSTYSSWWCSNSKLQGIRSTLTPVFSIASIILLFGFIINWLRNDTSSVTVTYDEGRDG